MNQFYYKNVIKKKILSKYFFQKTILHIGSCEKNDFYFWNKLYVPFCITLDIIEHKINKLNILFNSSNIHNNYKFLTINKNIYRTLNENELNYRYDIVYCNIINNLKEIENFISTLSKKVKKDGYLIIYHYNPIETKCNNYIINKLYEHKNIYKDYWKYKLYFGDSINNTIFKYTTKDITHICEKCYLSLHKIHKFDSYKLITKDSTVRKSLSMFQILVFKKNY